MRGKVKKYGLLLGYFNQYSPRFCLQRVALFVELLGIQETSPREFMLESWQLSTCPTSVLTEQLSWPLHRAVPATVLYVGQVW